MGSGKVAKVTGIALRLISRRTRKPARKQPKSIQLAVPVKVRPDQLLDVYLEMGERLV